MNNTLAAVLVVAAIANADDVERLRGTVTAFDGTVLAVKVRDGRDLTVKVPAGTAVSYPKPIRLADVKVGDFVGTAAMPDAGGRLVAREVHVFPESARGTGEGHRAWDLAAGATMTNANVAKMVKATDGEELTLEYKGGARKVVVPPGAPVVAVVPGDASLLVPGAYVFIIARAGQDGSRTATRIMAAKDGVKPPM